MVTDQTKHFATQFKPVIKKLSLQVATAVGKYQPFTELESECVQREAVPFIGDLPKGAGSEYNQYRLEYKIPRSLKEEVDDLVYTPRGMAWWRGRLYERFSLQEPSIKDLLAQPSIREAIDLPQGTIVQVETPYTYGDWVSEHLMCLVRAMPICSPLLLPKHLMNKSYVRRDLELLGVVAVAVDQPVLIRRALVLHKTRHSHYLTKEDVNAYRCAFQINPVQPRSGSILYLSRLGQCSEGYERQYPSELAAGVLQELGAKIILTANTTFEEYRALATDAETVVADFGSAYLNLLNWNTKNLIILFTDAWWDGCALFLSKALGISNIALIRVNNIDRLELHHKLVKCLDSFGTR